MVYSSLKRLRKGFDGYMATIQDIARKAKVSTSTVSHALNGTRYVSPEKRRLIEEAARELAYNPNDLASSLRRKRTQTVGVIIPDISNFFFSAVLNGLSKSLESAGYTLILCDSAEDAQKEHSHIKLLSQKRVDGLVVAPASGEADYLNLQKQVHCPLVFIDRLPSAALPFDAVLVDNANGTRTAVEHLIAKGHRRIGFISGLPTLSTSIERYRGYCEALSARGLEIAPEIIKNGNSRIDGGYQLTMAILKNEPRITAIFIANNLMTIGAVLALKELGMRIPEDIAVIGFDDYEWALITEPPLSVVRQPADEIGQRAGEILLQRMRERIAGQEQDGRQIIRLQTEVVLRRSC